MNTGSDAARSRSIRTARSLTAAGVSTLVAALSHVAGGGAAPGTVTIAIALALASLACIALSSKTLSLPRLSLSVLISQAGFHGLFSITGGSSALAMRHEHSTVSAAVDGSMQHAGAPMWLAHLIAAVITVAALAHGERLLALLVSLARLTLGRLSDVGESPAVDLRRSSDPVADHTDTLRSVLAALGGERRRGPPVLV